jgi:hypothetical protein
MINNKIKLLVATVAFGLSLVSLSLQLTQPSIALADTEYDCGQDCGGEGYTLVCNSGGYLSNNCLDGPTEHDDCVRECCLDRCAFERNPSCTFDANTTICANACAEEFLCY